MKSLESSYMELYGDNPLTAYRFHQLQTILNEAKKERNAELKQADLEGNLWYSSEKMIGIMLYVDRFCNDLQEFEDKIDYLVDLGITYVHFMPLLKSREGNNDGGYAVSDYLDVEERLGTMAQFEKVIHLLKKRGIRTCIDFVLNHTAKEHIWAEEYKKGNPDYHNMYHMFTDEWITLEYEKTLTEIFPEVSPKNFTFYPELNQHVMTRFYEFQWDLNYANPQVFNKIAEVLLKLANKGIDIFRLDAIPYMWKEVGTNCMNLPQVHALLSMYKTIVKEICPSVIFLGEAIVEPNEIVKYFGSKEASECDVMYNASMMVLLWNSLATKDVRLMEKSLSIDYGVPCEGVWINYARCHDDIGWGFEHTILKQLGMNPSLHKNFMIQFMEGKYPGSYATGELYEFNPVTLDARNSGTMASLCGLEQALNEKHDYKIELAIKRILLLNAMIISYTGIPLFYAGDEIGQLNDWDYKKHPEIAHDSRWLHRGCMDWESAKDRLDVTTTAGKIYVSIKKMIALRKSSELFSSSLRSIPVDTWNPSVFGFHKADKMLVLANFSDQVQWVDSGSFDWFGLPGEMKDMIQGRRISTYANQIMLGPYEFLWLCSL